MSFRPLLLLLFFFGCGSSSHGDDMDSADVHTNRLIDETSPYLLQHAHNPVDWYPWGEEAIAKAKEEGKPIFLSIGYSACHWCHVMERESFESEEIAAVLNEHFVAIKVDREERPDLDEIYMTAVTTLSGAGGWPMSVWLTPDLEPFYGGTYYPPESRYGRPGFKELLERIAALWATRREDVVADAGRLAEAVRRRGALTGSGSSLPEEAVVEAAVRDLLGRYDAAHGGFGAAPKFPHALDIELLLSRYGRSADPRVGAAARGSLEAMCRGGIHDHLAGGFARYSTDTRWQVPHFEKMLYDNALLARMLVEAHLAFGAEGPVDFRFYAEQTLDFVLREMTAPEGPFYSAFDADSEGEEGKFYVWTPAELEAVLGEEAALFARCYSVTEEGNFEGRNTLHIVEPWAEIAADHGLDLPALKERLASARATLHAARAARVPPALDDKAIVAWNGLMIRALARAGLVFEREDYVEAAARAAEFILAELRREDGRLYRTWRQGEARNPAVADDYGLLIDAIVELYEATFEPAWLERARELSAILLEDFYDGENGGFYYAAKDVENLFTRPKKAFDSVLPSGNSAALLGLFKLGRLLDDGKLRATVETSLAAYADVLGRAPQAFPVQLLLVDALTHPREIAVVGTLGEPATEELLRVVRRHGGDAPVAFLPVGAGEEAAALIPWLREREAVDGQPTVYICENFACQAPLTDPAAVAAALRR